MLVYQSVSGEWMISWNPWISRNIMLYQSNFENIDVKIIHPGWNPFCFHKIPKMA